MKNIQQLRDELAELERQLAENQKELAALEKLKDQHRREQIEKIIRWIKENQK